MLCVPPNIVGGGGGGGRIGCPSGLEKFDEFMSGGCGGAHPPGGVGGVAAPQVGPMCEGMLLAAAVVPCQFDGGRWGCDGGGLTAPPTKMFRQ